jgi:hypothetical protein
MYAAVVRLVRIQRNLILRKYEIFMDSHVLNAYGGYTVNHKSGVSNST